MIAVGSRERDSGSGVAEAVVESELHAGPPPRHIDQATAELDRYARTWLDFQGMRKATFQRELDECKRCDHARTKPKKMPGKMALPHARGCLVGALEAIETQVSARLSKNLRTHVLWPWLAQYPGLGGAHTALIIGRIGDPRRFPGQRCSGGHYLPPLYTVGATCPVAENPSESETRNGDGESEAGADEGEPASETASVCPGVMLPPRETTGVRSLWHWAGLHADSEGRAPRKRKGVQATWEPRVRASVMQPGGIAEQIVRLAVPHYAEVYREAKARLTLRVADASSESDRERGDANILRAADRVVEIGITHGRPLRPFEADRTARKVAAKAFLADLLTEWKRLA